MENREEKIHLAPRTPSVEIEMGAWAMHPEHGKVLIVSVKPNSIGGVLVGCNRKDHSTATAWVDTADLTPLSEDGPTPEPDEDEQLTQSFNMSKAYIDKHGDKWRWREDRDSDHLGEWVCYHRIDEGELTWEPIPPVIYSPYTEESE